MPKGKRLIGFVMLLVMLKGWLGIYEEDEFGTHHLFIKHRPVWQTYFYSPRGMSDLEPHQMGPTQRRDQGRYDEFILGR